MLVCCICNTVVVCNTEVLTMFTDTPDTSNCYVTTVSYAGDVNTTKDGIQCQRWDSETPRVPYYKPNPSAHNYCRDPSSWYTCIWCYTMDRDVRWECCNVWRCFTAHSRYSWQGQRQDCHAKQIKYNHQLQYISVYGHRTKTTRLNSR